MGKAKKGSKLLKALGKTKKEQMAKVYPKVKGQIRGKGPYVRGTIGKKGASDFEARRKVLRGDAQKALRTADKEALGALATTAVAGATGYAVGKGWHKKLAGAVTPKKKDTHLDKAREGAKSLIQKQKEKKGKREKMKEKLRKMVGPRKKTHHD